MRPPSDGKRSERMYPCYFGSLTSIPCMPEESNLMKISAISRMTRHLPAFAVLLVSPLVGVGCTPAPPIETSVGEVIAPGINQGILCTVDNLFPVECERGQKVLFMPPRFGNEQLPVIFAAGITVRVSQVEQ